MADGARTRAGRLVGDAVAPVDAATVLLLRDRLGGGLEVLLLERHLDSDFAGGALVFPGGKVDEADRELDRARWEGPALGWWLDRLGAATDPEALGLLVAAVRETFEEAGVLLARRRDGARPTPEDLASEDVVAARRRLATRAGAWDWRPWLAEQELVLDLGALALWSWWVTPAGQHRRFDTRFFAAILPEGQEPCHDAVETTDLRWMTPAEALTAADAGDATIIYPTRRNLLALSEFPSATAAWQAAADGTVDQRRIEPRIVHVGDRVMIQHPYEAGPEPI